MQVGQITEEAPGVVFVVMRDAIGGGAYQGVRKAREVGGGESGPEGGVAGLVVGNRLEVHVHFAIGGFHLLSMMNL